MTSPGEATLSGGCQCGAVRFRAGRLGRPSICHCRMCQKAFGSFYGPFVTAHEVTWTRGAPKRFASSDKVRRGFCADCGTPLTYEAAGAALEIAIGALDDPARAAPVIQVNPADKLPFVDGLHALPTRKRAEQPELEAFMASLTNYQHPDQDTAQWPPERAQ
jgi:hypothetical protein